MSTQTDTPQEKVADVRRRLAAAEAAVTAMGDVPPPGQMHVAGEQERMEEMGKAQAARIALQDQLGILERRLPYVGVSDEDLAVQLEDAQIDAERLKTEAADLAAAKRPAAARKVERLATEAGKRHYELMGENETRKQERGGEFLLNDLAVRAALRTRDEKLAGWRTELTRLEAQFQAPVTEGAPRYFDMKPIGDARRNIEILEKAIRENTPVQPDEIAAERAKIEETFPKPPGSWK